MENETNQLRQEAKALGIKNWHSKRIDNLKKDILKAKDEKLYPEDSENKLSKEEEGNKGFVEAAKEESFFCFPSPKGDKIGLYRRINFETYILPDKKDTSFEFVRWQNAK